MGDACKTSNLPDMRQGWLLTSYSPVCVRGASGGKSTRKQMAVATLTKRAVEGAEVRSADYFIWCDELPGFGVRIYPSGKRGYLVQ
jgi:hypothetical protein